jgi:hypothetical protein
MLRVVVVVVVGTVCSSITRGVREKIYNFAKIFVCIF